MNIHQLRGMLAAFDRRIAQEREIVESAGQRIKGFQKEREKTALALAQAEREAAFQERQARGKKWREENPEEFQTFLQKIKERIREDLVEGMLDGWWNLDDNDEPISPAICFDLSDFGEGDLMAHVMSRAGIFPSVSQAKKNGWDHPIKKGEFIVTKKKIRIVVK